MLKNDIRYIIALVLLVVVTHSFAPCWYTWLMDSVIGEWLQQFYDFMKSFCMVRFVFAALLFYCGLSYVLYINKDKDFRWYRPVLLVWIYVVLFDHNPLKFVILCGNYDFSHLSAIICLLVFIGMICKSVNRCHQDYLCNKSKKNVPYETVGFLNDDIGPQQTSKSLQEYADVIVGHLLRTNIDKQSFAVGITGEWGSGKSTFLKLLETKLKDTTEIVIFNPWMCRTPEQVTSDFFATLQQNLSSHYSSLSKPIHDYAKYISNATFSLGPGVLSKVTLATQHESLQKKKQRLSERFAKLKKPVVVIIDDLDRLESSEVFEVLRLIRNTADLKNIIYLVAYDKEYVTYVLTKKNIRDSSAYLEKIFPVEIHQPKVEYYQILQVLRNDLNQMKISGGALGSELLRMLNWKEKALVVKILGNYRQTRRFVRIYSLNVTYVRNCYANEIHLIDLFWMELLQVYDKKVYDLLGEKPV